MGSLCTRLVIEIWSFTGKGDHYYILTRHNDQFSHYNLMLRKLQEKMSRKALVNTKRNLLMLPGHPIILLKSNLYQYGDRNGKKVYWNSIK